MWIYEAYALHPNMRSHTGGAIYFGTDIIHSKTFKNNMNSKSRTEAELVGRTKYLPYSIWLMYLLE